MQRRYHEQSTLFQDALIQHKKAGSQNWSNAKVSILPQTESTTNNRGQGGGYQQATTISTVTRTHHTIKTKAGIKNWKGSDSTFPSLVFGLKRPLEGMCLYQVVLEIPQKLETLQTAQQENRHEFKRAKARNCIALCQAPFSFVQYYITLSQMCNTSLQVLFSIPGRKHKEHYTFHTLSLSESDSRRIARITKQIQMKVHGASSQTSNKIVCKKFNPAAKMTPSEFPQFLGNC